MALLSCQSLRIAFGGPPLLHDVSLQVERGERIGLVGRNGEGKSTLLRILEGTQPPDAGTLVLESGARVALLEQEVPAGLGGTVADVIAAGALDQRDPEHTVRRLCSLLELDGGAAFDAQS
ncbi:MAG: ABC-F family ATP-binding cassette domain-containing protein, partial [Gemmatimonadetes bacterium]|nr:ABC-F family ATP-binding cassette domain-containing protein [Gemmatimonadota bacterium]